MTDYKHGNEILLMAIDKLIELKEKAEWNRELLPLAPPVLWFGDRTQNKPIVLTLGANPSRQEFLRESKGKAKVSQKQYNVQKYLTDNNKRFFHFQQQEDLIKVKDDINLQNVIIESYNRYFITGNSYKWFGKNSFGRNDSYNVEGFLNGMGASYFGNSKLQAIHIDLLPYTTMSDFNEIMNLCRNDIFMDNWGNKMIIKLIELMNPQCLVIFGRNNLNHFNSLFTDLWGGRVLADSRLASF